MFEKNLGIALLIDFYGELLPERQRNVLSLYYNEDLSLAEIAAELGISRQGVRHIIKKAEGEILALESKLKLAKNSNQTEVVRNLANELEGLIKKHSDYDILEKKSEELMKLFDKDGGE